MPWMEYRDPNTGILVPIIGMTDAQADARYARTDNQAVSGTIAVPEPTASNHAVTRNYAETALALPAGAIFIFGANTIPSQWPFLFCQGQAVSRTTYAALYAVIGTTYGAGNGSTTFNLPDIRGRSPAGRYTADGGFDMINQKGGSKTVTLTKGHMPGNQTGYVELHNSAGPTILNTTTGDAMWGTGGHGSLYHSHENPNTAAESYGQTGFSLGFGGGAHNNLQPYAAMQFIIKF